MFKPYDPLVFRTGYQQFQAKCRDYDDASLMAGYAEQLYGLREELQLERDDRYKVTEWLENKFGRGVIVTYTKIVCELILDLGLDLPNKPGRIEPAPKKRDDLVLVLFMLAGEV